MIGNCRGPNRALTIIQGHETKTSVFVSLLILIIEAKVKSGRLIEGQLKDVGYG